MSSVENEETILVRGPILQVLRMGNVSEDQGKVNFENLLNLIYVFNVSTLLDEQGKQEQFWQQGFEELPHARGEPKLVKSYICF